MFPEAGSPTREFKRLSAVEWCLWIACVLTAAGSLIALVAPAGGTNRVSGVALPFAISAAALAANALTHRRNGWLPGLLYAVASLAILYAVILAVSLPLRLSIEGTCRPAPSPCPLGFDLPITARENFVVFAAAVSGVVSLVITFAAAELQFLPRRRRTPDPGITEKPL